MPESMSLHLRYLHQKHGESISSLKEMFPQYKCTTIHRHMKKQLGIQENCTSRKKKRGEDQTSEDQ